MEEIESPQVMEWLKSRLAPAGLDEFHVVSTIVPQGFSSYLRLFHSWYARHDKSIRSTWYERAIAANLPYGSQLPLGQIERSLDDSKGDIYWMIDEGEPDQETRDTLRKVLEKATGDQSVFFSYELAATVRGADDPLIVRAQLNEIESVRRRLSASYPPRMVGPNHWWPEDHSWVVATDYDLCSTYVGCSRKIADSLLAAPKLEAVEVRPDERLR